MPNNQERPHDELRVARVAADRSLAGKTHVMAQKIGTLEVSRGYLFTSN